MWLDGSSMADGIKKQTEEYDRMKWNLQFRIQEMEQELSLQRQVDAHTHFYTSLALALFLSSIVHNYE